MEFYMILALTAFAAAFIQGVSGFAFAVILLGVLPHFIDYIQAVGLVSLLAVIVVSVNAWTYRANVLWKLLLFNSAVILRKNGFEEVGL